MIQAATAFWNASIALCALVTSFQAFDALHPTFFMARGFTGSPMASP
jgi:hypothetical protein